MVRKGLAGLAVVLPSILVLIAVAALGALPDGRTAGVAGAATLRDTAVSGSAPAPAGTFLETFDGAPSSPRPWRPSNWDVTVHSRDTGTWAQLEPMHAMHGSDCGAPPATHDISSYDDAVFQCRDHLMTAIRAGGYGLIYLTPNQLVDFSAGEAVVKFDLSTLNTSSRDWPDLWISPFNENLQLALDNWIPDGNGEPRDAVHIKLENEVAKPTVIRNFAVQTIDANWWTTYESFLTASASRRDTFELHISNTHIKFGMPAYNFWWVDTDIAPLGWTSGVLQLGHHSYNPEKACNYDGTCSADTWHWDNVSISPATPFTLLRADRRSVDATTSAQLNFPAAAPAGSHLRFTGIGSDLGVSYDGGRSWQTPQLQSFAKTSGDEHFRSYWTAVPAGTTAVQFRGSGWYAGPWLVRNVSIWASDAPTFVPPPPVFVPPPPIFVPPPPTFVPPAPSGPSAPRSGPSAAAAAFGGAWVDESAFPTLEPGHTATVTMHFRNTGAVSWQVGTPGQQVNLGIDGDVTTFAALGIASDWLSANRPATTSEAVVAPGEIGTFAFNVRAPTTAGEFRIPLRLVADGVTWLPDEGVYLLVRSDYGFHSRWATQTPWPVVHAGEVTTPITIAFRNAGVRPWVRGLTGQEVALGIVGDDSSCGSLGVGWPAADRPAIQAQASVDPGANATFTFQVRAPARPGTCILRLRPVVDGVTWLDDDGVFVQLTVVP